MFWACQAPARGTTLSRVLCSYQTSSARKYLREITTLASFLTATTLPASHSGGLARRTLPGFNIWSNLLNGAPGQLWPLTCANVLNMMRVTCISRHYVHVLTTLDERATRQMVARAYFLAVPGGDTGAHLLYLPTPYPPPTSATAALLLLRATTLSAAAAAVR